MDTPRINQSLKDYCFSVADWDSKDWVLFVHGWWEKMSAAFGLQTATPAIRIEAVRNGAAGRYQAGRNGFGLLHQLSIDPRRRDDPPALLLAGLLRELLQECATLEGRVHSARYYDSALRARAGALGVDFDRRGRLLGVQPGPFTEFLESEGVDISVFEEPSSPALELPRRRRPRKWSCECSEISAAGEVNIRCNDCQRDFQRRSSSPMSAVPLERDTPITSFSSRSCGTQTVQHNPTPAADVVACPA
jgi:hypothetical protein